MNRGEELKTQLDADDTHAIHKAIETEKRSVEHCAAHAKAAARASSPSTPAPPTKNANNWTSSRASSPA